MVSLFIGPLATIVILLWPRLPTSGSADWPAGQLISGGAVALVGALVCTWAALCLSGGFPLWALCGCFLVGASVFVWLFVRERAGWIDADDA